MSDNETIIRFSGVSFHFDQGKTIIEDSDFSVRKGMKVALMGQNGAGKSTIFRLMTGSLKPISGSISVNENLVVATASQVVSREDLHLTVEEYFRKHSGLENHELKRAVARVLDVVHQHAPLDKPIKNFSGGQQARLLLASALIRNPDVLLLDEPTNNLDYEGIAHLTDFLIGYPKSCIIISHDADFLNAFTQGVLYLDSFTHTIEQYQGNYYDVVEEIAVRIEKENRQNALLEKNMQANKEKANFFANKGGKMRLVAKKMREKVEQYESEKVAVRKEDKTIRNFTISSQPGLTGDIVKISSVTVMRQHIPMEIQTNIRIGRKEHLLISGPNGIGKSTLIESIATNRARGATIQPGVRIGYYRQDFSTLDYNDTIHESLRKALADSGTPMYEQDLRSVASGFLITNDLIQTKIGHISEGMKGLVSFTRLVLQKPGLLILDEPTNHINFRHLPVIARALDMYDGAMILVSHVPDFIMKIRIDTELDLEK